MEIFILIITLLKLHYDFFSFRNKFNPSRENVNKCNILVFLLYENEGANLPYRKIFLRIGTNFNNEKG